MDESDIAKVVLDRLWENEEAGMEEQCNYKPNVYTKPRQ